MNCPLPLQGILSFAFRVDCRLKPNLILLKIRVYEKQGAGMEWHIDDILYNPEQVEVVLTIENNSDCCTMWKPHDQPLNPIAIVDTNSNQQQYRVESVQTTPNSALILRAGSIEHKVSPLKAGKRVILKMAFVRKDAVMNVGMEEHVSHHANVNTGSERRSSKSALGKDAKGIEGKKKKVSQKKRR